MKSPTSIDPTALQTVTGGGTVRAPSTSSSGIDSLINQLNSLTSSIRDINQKTSGFSSSEMLVLCMLAMQQHQPGVVFVNRRYWW